METTRLWSKPGLEVFAVPGTSKITFKKIEYVGVGLWWVVASKSFHLSQTLWLTEVERSSTHRKQLPRWNQLCINWSVPQWKGYVIAQIVESKCDDQFTKLPRSLWCGCTRLDCQPDVHPGWSRSGAPCSTASPCLPSPSSRCARLTLPGYTSHSPQLPLGNPGWVALVIALFVTGLTHLLSIRREPAKDDPLFHHFRFPHPAIPALGPTMQAVCPIISCQGVVHTIQLKSCSSNPEIVKMESSGQIILLTYLLATLPTVAPKYGLSLDSYPDSVSKPRTTSVPSSSLSL